MIIRDKQDLRKCVKQSVRRASVIETNACIGLLNDGYGVARWLGCSSDTNDPLQAKFSSLCCGSPLASRHAELLAALDAMNLPVHDLDKAESIIAGYDRCAYMKLALDAIRAERVLVDVPAEEIDAFDAPDSRFAPLLSVSESWFVPGRYGVDYAQCAARLEEAVRRSGAKDIRPLGFDAFALAYCILPVCEDQKLLLHVHIEQIEQWQGLRRLLLAHPDVRVLASAAQALETVMIQDAAKMPHILICVESAQNMSYALNELGTCFVPFASHADSPEALVGRWLRAKEIVWQALSDAYLPLARTGYELTREQIEADVQMLLGGNLKNLYETI